MAAVERFRTGDLDMCTRRPPGNIEPVDHSANFIKIIGYNLLALRASDNRTYSTLSSQNVDVYADVYRPRYVYLHGRRNVKHTQA